MRPTIPKTNFCREIPSDPRPRVTRPAPAGHTTCARGSRDLRPRVADYMPKRNGNNGSWEISWINNGDICRSRETER